MDATSRIAALAGPAAQTAGLIVDGVEVAAAGSGTRVLVTVDLPDDQVGAASLDAIAAASRAIGAALDGADVPRGAYVLEVSTPGIGRPLTERRHFLRARTRLVTLELAAGGTATGRLVEVDGDQLVLETLSGPARVALGDVVRGRIEIEFRRPGDDAELDDAEGEG